MYMRVIKKLLMNYEGYKFAESSNEKLRYVCVDPRCEKLKERGECTYWLQLVPEDCKEDSLKFEYFIESFGEHGFV